MEGLPRRWKSLKGQVNQAAVLRWKRGLSSRGGKKAARKPWHATAAAREGLAERRGRDRGELTRHAEIGFWHYGNSSFYKQTQGGSRLYSVRDIPRPNTQKGFSVCLSVFWSTQRGMKKCLKERKKKSEWMQVF